MSGSDNGKAMIELENLNMLIPKDGKLLTTEGKEYAIRAWSPKVATGCVTWIKAEIIPLPNKVTE